MAINRVDVTGTFIRQDVAHVRQEEDNRAYAEMTRLSSQFEQRAEEVHNSVTGTEAFEAQDEKYDASEEGKNKHLLNNRRGKASARKKAEDQDRDPDGIIVGPNGKPLIGARHSAFDLKI